MKATNTFLIFLVVLAVSCSDMEHTPHGDIHFKGNDGQSLLKPVDLVFFNDSYHLFYHYTDEVSSDKHTGHAISQDLHQWDYISRSVPFSSAGGVTTFFKTTTLSGKKEDQLAACRIAPGNAEVTYFTASGKKHTLWSEYPDKGKLPKAPDNIRDIKLFHRSDQPGYGLAVLTGKEVWFYTSEGLLQWHYAGKMGRDVLGNVTFEDIDMIEMSIEDSEISQWVLLLSATEGSPNQDAGTKYFVGKTAHGVFSPSIDNFGWMDYGSDHQHAVTCTNDNGPRDIHISLGMISKQMNAGTQLSLPRRITLYKEYNHIFMRSRLWKGVEEIAGQPHRIKEIKYSGPVTLFKEMALPLRGDFHFDMNNRRYLDFAADFGVQLKTGDTLYKAGYHNDRRYFYISENMLDEEGKYRIISQTYAPIIFTGGTMDMQIFVSQHSLELFALDGKVSMSKAITLPAELSAIGLYTQEGGVTLQKGTIFLTDKN